jgi:hypothetical protein
MNYHEQLSLYLLIFSLYWLFEKSFHFLDRRIFVLFRRIFWADLVIWVFQLAVSVEGRIG